MNDKHGVEIQDGDLVTWYYVPPGGWGWVIPVKARVVRMTAKRVVIAAQLQQGGTKEGRVKPESIAIIKRAVQS